MADVKTSWEIELIDDVSGPAKRAESALSRVQRRMEQLGAQGGALTALGRSARTAFAYINTAAYASAVRLRQMFGGSVVARGFMAMRARARETFAYIDTAAYAMSQNIRRSIARSLVARAMTLAGSSIGGYASAAASKVSGAASAAGSLSVSAGRALFGTGSGARVASAMASAYGAMRTKVVAHFGALRASAAETFAYIDTIAFATSLKVRRYFGERLTSAFQKAGKSIREAVPKAIGAAGSKMVEYSKNAVLFAAILGGVAVAKIGATSAAMTDFSQKSRKSFEMMTGGAETGNAAFEKFRGTALQLGMGIRTQVGNAQSLMAKGFTVPETDALLRMGADMTALGSSSEKVQSVFDAMGKIKATGYLQGDELNMLVEAGISSTKIYDALGAKLGKTRQELIKMKEGGKLAASDVLNAVGSAVLQTTGQKEFGAARLKIKDSSLSGIWDTMRTNAEDVWLRIGEASGARFTAAFAKIAGRINSLITGKGADSIVEKVASGIASVATWVESAIPYVERFASAFGGGFSEAMRAIGPALTQFSDSGGDWTATLSTIGTTLGQLTALALGAAGVFGGILAAGIAAASYAVQGLESALGRFVDFFGWVAFRIEESWANLGARWRAMSFAAVGDLIQGVVDGVAAGIGKIWDAGVGLARAMIDAFRGPQGIDAHSPSRKFQALADMSVEGYAGRFRDASNDNGLPGVTAPALRDLASSTVPSGGRSGGTVVNLTLTVQAPPGGTAADGEAWGRGAARGMRGGLAGALEDLALETGT